MRGDGTRMLASNAILTHRPHRMRKIYADAGLCTCVVAFKRVHKFASAHLCLWRPLKITKMSRRVEQENTFFVLFLIETKTNKPILSLTATSAAASEYIHKIPHAVHLIPLDLLPQTPSSNCSSMSSETMISPSAGAYYRWLCFPACCGLLSSP